MSEVSVRPHSSLRVRTFTTMLPAALADLPSPEQLVELLRLDAPSPVHRADELRSAIRDMLRHGGYKPTGRGKPASEYLLRVAQEGGLRSINAVVDACNVASLHSGFPISVVDVDRAQPLFHIAIAGAGEKYVFNVTGQEIDVGGLVCLFDSAGPCANAVKDSQRTKTGDATRQTLSVVWGAAGFEELLDETVAWYRALLVGIGAETETD